MSDWDAERYHRLSDPQFEWGRRVISRLAPAPGERILDLGCGTGRLTAELVTLIGSGLLVAVDRSNSMLCEARANASERWAGSRPHPVSAGPPVHLVRADGTHLPFVDVFDAVFSAATFHWIPDHEELFASIYRALVPGGRLVAQCGGGPNLEVLLTRARALMAQPRWAPFFDGWGDPWNFADVPSTLTRLERAGFTALDVTLHAAPTTLPDAGAYQEFLSCVCVRHHVERLPPDERPAFLAALAELAATDDPPFTLDYWRLNLSARKPTGAVMAA